MPIVKHRTRGVNVSAIYIIFSSYSGILNKYYGCFQNYVILGRDIARYQPRPCGQQEGFAPTFFLEKNIWQKYFLEIFLVNFFEKIFFWKIFLVKIFFWKIFLVKIFLTKIFSAKIFISYPSPIWLPYKLPPPLLSSSSVIFEVECDKRTKRTHGPDAHTYCLFYSIR